MGLGTALGRGSGLVRSSVTMTRSLVTLATIEAAAIERYLASPSTIVLTVQESRRSVGSAGAGRELRDRQMDLGAADRPLRADRLIVIDLDDGQAEEAGGGRQRLGEDAGIGLG